RARRIPQRREGEKRRAGGADRRRQERALRGGARRDGRAAQAGGGQRRPSGKDQSMSALAFPRKDEPALVRSFALAALVHLLLLGVMFLGVRWQSHQPDTVTVELWDAPPAPPAAPLA